MRIYVKKIGIQNGLNWNKTGYNLPNKHLHSNKNHKTHNLHKFKFLEQKTNIHGINNNVTTYFVFYYIYSLLLQSPKLDVIL